MALLKDVSRKDIDEFAVRSQNLAHAAIANGFWSREIDPVETPSGAVVTADDGPRSGVTYDGVAALKPVFRDNGRVTAGTCCGLNDGAAALVIMSDGKAAAFGIATLGSYRVDRCQCVVAGNHGPGPGCGRTRQALARAGMTIGDMDLVEINEAFAAQVIPSYRELGIDIAHLNVNGGAIAVGHPFGMTGARIGATLIRSLQFHNKQFGPETMCVGGGQGMALILGRMS